MPPLDETDMQHTGRSLERCNLVEMCKEAGMDLVKWHKEVERIDSWAEEGSLVDLSIAAGMGRGKELGWTNHCSC